MGQPGGRLVGVIPPVRCNYLKSVRRGATAQHRPTDATTDRASSGDYKTDATAFMFSLESGIDGQREPVQLPLVDPLDPHAVLHRATYLPTFGAGHDLYVAANASTSNSSMSNLRTYAMPDGGGGADANNTYLTGSQSFRPDAVEVLQVTAWGAVLEMVHLHHLQT